MSASDPSLRELLSRSGSYPAIAAAVAAGRLPHFPVALFDHVGDVYRRVEIVGDRDFERIAELRLAALVHEEPHATLPRLLSEAGVGALAPTVIAVADGFGRVWKLASEDDLLRWVGASRPHLGPILLFELAHEGRPTAEMERAAAVGGLEASFARWAGRLADATSLHTAPLALER